MVKKTNSSATIAFHIFKKTSLPFIVYYSLFSTKHSEVVLKPIRNFVSNRYGYSAQYKVFSLILLRNKMSQKSGLCSDIFARGHHLNFLCGPVLFNF